MTFSDLKKILKDIADAIRSKTGKSELIYPENMGEEILKIECGSSGDDLPESFKANYLVSGDAQQMVFALKGQFDLTSVTHNDAWYDDNNTSTIFTLYAIDIDGTIYDGVDAMLRASDGYVYLDLISENKTVWTSNYLDGKTSKLKDEIISFGADYQTFPSNTSFFYVIAPHAVTVS